MKKYEMPEIKINQFVVEDIVTTSNPGADENFGGTGNDD